MSRILLFGGAAGLALWSVLEVGLHASVHGDLWWYLAAGRLMTQTHELARADAFTHTFHGAPWVNLEWLTQVLFYNVYRLGENGITVLRVVLVFAIFGVALRSCVERSRSWLISLLVVALGAWACKPLLDARAQLFTFLNAALLLWILHRYRRRGQWGPLLALPVLFGIWTQLHFGYALGLLILLGNLLAESGKRLLHLPEDALTWRRIGLLAGVTVLSAGAVLANPWTVEAYVEPLSLVLAPGGTSPWMDVAEWRPPRFGVAEPGNPQAFWLQLGLLAAACAPIAGVAWRRFDLNDVGLAAVLAVGFALQHRRFIPLFVILTLPLLAFALHFWAERWATEGRRRALAVGAWLVLLAVVPVRAQALAARYGQDGLFRVNTGIDFFPEEAVRFLREIAIPGRMFNLYSWGGYLAYHLPEKPTFIDGRSIIFDSGFYVRYDAARQGVAGWRRFLERHGVTFALLQVARNDGLIKAMIADPEWTLLYFHDESAVLVKEAPVNRAVLARLDAGRLPLPDAAGTHFVYGWRAFARGNRGRAADEFAEAARRAPESPLYRSSLLLALDAAGRSEALRSEALRAVRDFPDSDLARQAEALLEPKGISPVDPRGAGARSARPESAPPP